MLASSFLLLLLAGAALCGRRDQASTAETRSMLLNSGHILTVRPTGPNGTVTVNMTFHLTNIDYLDEERGVLQVTGFLGMSWEDDRMYPGRHMESRTARKVLIESSLIWTPDIELFNPVAPGLRKLGMNKDRVIVLPQHRRVDWVPQIAATVPCLSFGEDIVNCTLRFGSWVYDGDEVDIQSVNEESATTDFVNSNPHWILAAYQSQKFDIYYPCCDNPFVVINVGISLRRRGT